MLVSLLWQCLTVPSLLQLCQEPNNLFSLLSKLTTESFCKFSRSFLLFLKSWNCRQHNSPCWLPLSVHCAARCMLPDVESSTDQDTVGTACTGTVVQPHIWWISRPPDTVTHSLLNVEISRTVMSITLRDFKALYLSTETHSWSKTSIELLTDSRPGCRGFCHPLVSSWHQLIGWLHAQMSAA